MNPATKWIVLPLASFSLVLGLLAIFAAGQGDHGWALGGAFLSGSAGGISAGLAFIISKFGKGY